MGNHRASRTAVVERRTPDAWSSTARFAATTSSAEPLAIRSRYNPACRTTHGSPPPRPPPGGLVKEEAAVTSAAAVASGSAANACGEKGGTVAVSVSASAVAVVRKSAALRGEVRGARLGPRRQGGRIVSANSASDRAEVGFRVDKCLADHSRRCRSVTSGFTAAHVRVQ